MKVKLVGITEPKIEGLDSPGELIAFAARVSNPSNQFNKLTSAKLLKYLVKHKHWSPFEMTNVVLEIETTRDIARQILRHRSFSFQEFSQRYADPTGDLGFINREARFQDKTNRQNSISSEDYHGQDEFVKDKICNDWNFYQNQVLSEIRHVYNWAIENGIAKEQARAILPEGLTVSRMYMNGTLRSWIHYCSLRSGPETQKEHREIAIECWKVILSQFPELSEIEIDS